MKKVLSVVSVVMLLSIAGPLHAQSGCVNSPENPTAILLLVGSAGAAFAGLRGRFRR